MTEDKIILLPIEKRIFQNIRRRKSPVGKFVPNPLQALFRPVVPCMVVKYGAAMSQFQCMAGDQTADLFIVKTDIITIP